MVGMPRTSFHAAGSVPVSVTDYFPFQCILNGSPIQVPTVDGSYSAFTVDIDANGGDSAFATPVEPYVAAPHGYTNSVSHCGNQQTKTLVFSEVLHLQAQDISKLFSRTLHGRQLRYFRRLQSWKVVHTCCHLQRR